MDGQPIFLGCERTGAHRKSSRAVGPENSKTCDNCGEVFYRDTRNTYAYWKKARFCSRACFGKWHAKHCEETRPPMAVVFQKWFDRPEDGCWMWKGALDKDGYGVFTYAGKTFKAHAIALKLDGRPVPKGMLACHTCDTPGCVRADHLYPGTHLDNMADARARGRTCFGSKQYAAKLTDADVLAIRSSVGSKSEIARRYGISPSNVGMILARRTWRHI